MTWLERIERLMDEKGWNQYHLADASGFSQPHIHRLLKQQDLPSEKALKKLAAAFDVPVEYFTTGIQRPDTLNVPLLQPEQIADWLEKPDLLHNNITVWQAVSQKCSDKAYALKVVASDMNNPQGVYHYPINSIVIVDPDRPLAPGYRVVCQLPDNRIVFRELQLSAGEFYLTALLPSFPMISLGSELNVRNLGRVICTIIPDQN